MAKLTLMPRAQRKVADDTKPLREALSVAERQWIAPDFTPPSAFGLWPRKRTGPANTPIEWLNYAVGPGDFTRG